MFCNSGSEATYYAIRLARAATGRNGVVKFQGCYHGFHDAVAMNVASPAAKMGQRDLLSTGMVPEVAGHTEVCRFNALEDVERVVRERPKQIAAVILEPIPHNVGCILPDQEFLLGLRNLCTREGIVLIFDEVISGFRHHLGGIQAIRGVTPDLTTLSKSMANGYPCAAVGGTASLMDHFNTRTGGGVYFAGTFNGHPCSMAACIATIKLLESGEVHRRIFRLGHMMREGLEGIFKSAGIPVVVTGFGSVFVVYFMNSPVHHYGDLLRNDAAMFVGTRLDAMRQGVFMLPVNLKRCCVSAAHTAADVAQTLDVMQAVVKKRGKP